MTIFWYCYLFFAGLLLGSFYNVVGLRVPYKQSIVTPRSHCPYCKRTLKPLELIPVLSFLFLKGKCSSCSKSISMLYPSIELSTALLFVFSYWHFGWTGELFISFVVVSLLMIITVSDLAVMLIPDKILVVCGLLLIVLRILFPMEPWWNSLLGSITGFGLLYCIAVISKGGMGGGDIKLFAVLGIGLGWKGILIAFFFAAFLGSVIGGLLLLAGKVKRKQKIPFGPFIAVGALFSLYFGEHFLLWYFGW
jgi:leader peptidase (prepilin peptidase)/N-methyltransferase